MKSLLAQPLNSFRNLFRVRNRRIRKRAARDFGRVNAALTVNMVEAFRTIVKRRKDVVIDGPLWRCPVSVFGGLEVFSAKPKKHTTPEFRVSAYAIMSIRPESVSSAI